MTRKVVHTSRRDPAGRERVVALTRLCRASGSLHPRHTRNSLTRAHHGRAVEEEGVVGVVNRSCTSNREPMSTAIGRRWGRGR
jgi:hypothetical protein